MINPLCDKCKKELDEFGGIVLSPPNKAGMVNKYHLCKECYQKLWCWIFNFKHID